MAVNQVVLMIFLLVDFNLGLGIPGPPGISHDSGLLRLIDVDSGGYAYSVDDSPVEVLGRVGGEVVENGKSENLTVTDSKATNNVSEKSTNQIPNVDRLEEIPLTLTESVQVFKVPSIDEVTSLLADDPLVNSLGEAPFLSVADTIRNKLNDLSYWDPLSAFRDYVIGSKSPNNERKPEQSFSMQNASEMPRPARKPTLSMGKSISHSVHRPKSALFANWSVTDYEVAVWFGFAIGAVFVLLTVGAVAAIRRCLPRSSRYIFRRPTYGRVTDLSLPVDSSAVVTLWSAMYPKTSDTRTLLENQEDHEIVHVGNPASWKDLQGI